MVSTKPMDFIEHMSEGTAVCFLLHNVRSWSFRYYNMLFFFKGLPSSSFIPSCLTTFQKLLLIKVFRPDHFVVACSAFIFFTMGKVFVTPSGFDLRDLYAESNCRTPLMFILSPGIIILPYLFRPPCALIITLSENNTRKKFARPGRNLRLNFANRHDKKFRRTNCRKSIIRNAR